MGNPPAPGEGQEKVTARFLLTTFDAVYLLALAGWVGSLLFYSFGVAPILARGLDAVPAARLVQALFLRCCAWGATCGAVALPALVGGPLAVPEYRGSRTLVQALLIVGGILVMFYGSQTLVPALQVASESGPGGRERFDRLHRRGLWLNGAVLLIGVGLLIAQAARPAPRTRGIIEPGPLGETAAGAPSAGAGEAEAPPP